MRRGGGGHEKKRRRRGEEKENVVPKRASVVEDWMLLVTQKFSLSKMITWHIKRFKFTPVQNWIEPRIETIREVIVSAMSLLMEQFQIDIK